MPLIHLPNPLLWGGGCPSKADATALIAELQGNAKTSSYDKMEAPGVEWLNYRNIQNLKAAQINRDWGQPYP
jgi:hypothetical protein